MQVVNKWLFLLVIVFIAGCNADLDKPIPQDPNWTQHQLDNGLRYHLYPTDDEEVSIRLMIHAGSLQESQLQQGYAHFVEHMAFNGSRNFSGNDVIKLFEKTGGSFGADINAFTGYQLTSYKMDLSSQEHLSLALSWMRDVADGILLDPAQVEVEKGVILGEFRASRPESEPLFTKAYLATIKGSELEDRDALGTKESVKQATAQGLRDYYQRWYLPQNAELIIAGDINPDQIAQQISEYFSSWSHNDQPPMAKQRAFDLDVQSRTLANGEMESPSLHLIVDRGLGANTTYQQLYNQMLDEVSQQLITQRLRAAFNDAALAVPFSASYESWVEYNRYAITSIEFPAKQRQVTQKLMLETLRSLRDHGVSQSELESIMTGYQSALANLDSNWDKRKPIEIVDQKVFAIEQAMPVQSRETSRQALTAFIEYVDLNKVNQQLNELLSSDGVWLQGYSNDEPLPALQQNLAKLPQQYAEPGVKPLVLIGQDSQLLQPTGYGSIVSEQDKGHQVKVWQLSNGIEVWYQRDPKAGQRAHLVYASQGGKAALTPDLYAASNVVIQAAIRSGLGKFSGPQLDSYLKKNDVGVFPFIGLTFHGVEINSAAKSLPLALNTIYNVATAVKVEPRQLEAVKQEYYQNTTSYLNSAEGRWYKTINVATYQPNSRHSFVTNADMALVTPEQTLQVHQRLFDYNRDNKLVIIADLEPQQVAVMLRKYIASIELNADKPAALNLAIGYQQALPQQLNLAENNESNTMLLTRLINTKPRAKVAKDVFAEDILRRIAAARLLDEVREKRGLDYAPEIYPVTQDGELISDWFVTAKLADEDIKQVNLALDNLFNQLATSITEQELSTAALQLTLDLEPLKDDPVQRAWFYSRYLIHGYGIDALFDIKGTSDSISLQDIQQRANWTFGANSHKMTATLTPKS